MLRTMSLRARLGRFLILVLAAGGCAKARSESATLQAVPVVVAAALQKDVPIEIRAVGAVEPMATVAVRPQAGGEITAVHFHEGADVRAGDLLFSLDARPYEAALAQAESNLVRDQSQARNAEAEARRSQELFAQGIVSKEQHDSVQARATGLHASVKADEAAVQTARLQLGYCSIRAPIGGRTGSLLIKAGNVVRAADAGPLVVINQIDPISVSFTVPEARFPEVKRAAGARRLSVEALLPGEDASPMTGALSFFDNEIDRATGTVRLRGTFANPNRRLWPGQFVGTRLVVDMRRNAVVVPSQAVQEGQSGPYLFVVKPDRTVELRPLVVSPASPGELLVEKGVAAGETIVTDGQLRLVPGSKIDAK
jgi:multidrug efflux system membrane fusion protein